ncbi:hypothetical protein [Haloarchaeobius sp. DFWS5]|uniref:hypothetical protein n=1 Tax=Haloarchaeobius sp. DFWS5 TaxID=3446114 RepID=UPI003EBEA7CD
MDVLNSNVDPISPDDLKRPHTPAFVEVLCTTDGTTEHISVANIAMTESGSYRFIEWGGRHGELPAWRVAEIGYLETEEEWNGGDFQAKRVTEIDRDALPRAEFEALGIDLDVDGGEN